MTYLSLWSLAAIIVVTLCLGLLFRLKQRNKQLSKALKACESSFQTEKNKTSSQSASKVGGWEFDYQSRELSWDTHTKTIHDVDETFRPTLKKAFRFLTPSSRRLLFPAIKKAKEQIAPFDKEVRLVTAGGRHIWVRILGQPILENGILSKFSGVFQDVSQYRRLQDELRLAAVTDQLTGLINRRGLHEYLNELNKSDQHSRHAVLAIDLDNFKSVNNTSDHETGDNLLRHCAKILTSEAGDADLVARIAGDEFVIVLKDANDRAQTKQLALCLMRKLSKPVEIDGRCCRISASIGIKFWDKTAEPTLKRVLIDADIALRQAKREGRSRYRFFKDSMRQQIERNSTLAEEIREGLRRDEFAPFFQPQINIRTRTLNGYEALLRWKHPSRGWLEPEDFIHAAKDADLLDNLDRQMLLKSSQSLAHLQALGLPAPQISINMSNSRLSDSKVVDNLIDVVKAQGLHPHQIALEILETVFLDDPAGHIAKNVHELSAAGFSVELDDFGTGHASISSLRKFPVDRIKIDRSFVSGIDQDKSLEELIGAIVHLAKKLNLTVIAECVETDAELAVLTAMGCDCAQGFYFAPAMPLAELENWLSSETQFTSQAR
ncbi:EAL domain-containing protein [Pseudohalocynthiibacter sp. F2068]|jgi:diguanylate cyclase (GGDEF)-like protein|uniref:putative bifunctional diguanylate cyclase/phosphodiesterase n=1 Tax=Pseudohalocynthiibacter sp. F2068 TaxID=2926418 RepID=UPI001FF26FE9|nr:EAL domain-containing protein [Pseudohalocynthiibacter sp. F2068]MCK0102105.1 EAL domain-containing protein [Pseudohalocynthiibacter sp. F2068]